MELKPATLRALRAGLGLTQTELAAALNPATTDRTIRRWEAGDAAIDAAVPEQLVELREWRDAAARRWIIAGTVTIPGDRQGRPDGLWWAAAARAAEVLGCEVDTEQTSTAAAPRRHTHLSPEDLDQIRALYDAGATTREVADTLGVAHATTIGKVVDARRRGQERAEVDDQLVCDLFQKGWTLTEIMRRTRLGKSSVRRRLMEAGLIAWDQQPPQVVARGPHPSRDQVVAVAMIDRIVPTSRTGASSTPTTTAHSTHSPPTITAVFGLRPSNFLTA